MTEDWPERFLRKTEMLKTDNMRGALLMMLSMAAFTLNDTLIKTVAGDVPLFQAVFLRGLLTTAMIVAIAASRGAFRVRITAPDWRTIGLRTVGEIGSTVFYLVALFHMKIGSVIAILQSLPLAITLAGALFFHERVGWRRYLAIMTGFFGVMLIVQPGTTGFNGYSVLALLAVVFVVLRDLATRGLSDAVPSILVALSASVSVTVLGAGGTLVEGWQPVDSQALIALVGAAVFIVAGYMFAVMVMRVGDIAFVSTFRYTALLWGLILGFAVFGEIPDGLTALGSLVVVGMGVFTLYRERQIAKSAVANQRGC